MTDWTRQISEFQRNWMEQQQKLMSSFAESLQQAGEGSPQQAWRQAVDMMEQQMTTALDSERKSLEALVEHVSDIENAPKELADWSRQVEQGIQLWTDLQQRVWRLWFDMLRNTVPREQPGETLARRWGEMVENVMDLQKQWLSDWKSVSEGRGRASRKRGGRSSRQGSGGQGQGED